MGKDQELKFVCKVCSKRFLSGKCLGGHMRGHVASISHKKHEAREDVNVGSDNFGHSGYGLRENPKKVWKVSDSNNGGSQQERVKNRDMGFEGGCLNAKKRVSDSKHCVCKECGKGFDSMRALSGHMRCHSLKDKEEVHCKECGKGFESMRALFGHMRSHSKRSRPSNHSSHSGGGEEEETECLIRRKRSRTRYKLNNSSLSNLNASCSSVCDAKEVEEIAMCLLMLSRGVRNWADFISVTDSSDNNNFVNFETQSLYPCKGITNTDDGDDACKMKPLEKLDSCVSGSGDSEFADFSSECGSDDDKNVELGVSVDGFLREDEIDNREKDDESGPELLCDSEIEKGLEKDMMKEIGFGQDELELVRPSSSKKSRFVDVHDTELEVNSCETTNFTKPSTEMLRNSPKKSEYKCRTCNKIFHSYQALGGHMTSHKTVSGSSSHKVESYERERGVETNILAVSEAIFKPVEDEWNENSNEDGLLGGGGDGVAVTRNEFKRSKHECPVCFKVFASGQALGGHKRAHYVAVSESRAKETVSIEQELINVRNSFDLNLPVEEADGDANDGFDLWWIGTDHKREPLVISS